ncbi:MAG: KH domain-containing protein [Eubacteriales bacterium]|nr:KH domain-containing protein [Eubacteriales bacterium]
MKDMIAYIAKTLVDDKDAVVVTQTDSPDGIIINLSVAEGDMGKVIGKQGRIAKSIRTLVKAATARSEKPVFLEIR